MKSFSEWSEINEQVKNDLQKNHNHEILNIRMNILSIIDVLKESKNPFEIISYVGWHEIKNKHDVFGSYLDRLIGSLGETKDLEYTRFFNLITLAKQRNMKMDLTEMSKDIEELYKKIKMYNA